MEAILLLQVQKRLDALSKGHIEARELLAQISDVTEGVYEMDFVGATLRLRQLIELYDKETNRLTPVATTEASVNLLSEGFQVQMEAEATLTKMTTYERCLKENATPNQEIPAPGSTTRLPKLEPTKFSGDILRFTEFWDKFESNIGSKTLRNVDKMAYLVSSLEGRARETVEGLPVTNENYFIAVDTLKTRYGSKDRVVDAHYKEITNMLKCSDNAEEALRSLDNIERHLRVLQSLGENIESNHLRSIIMEKFPERILYEVNVRLTGAKSVSDIREVLRTVLTAMESSQSKFSAATSPSTPITTSTEALYVKTSDKPTKPKFNERRQQRSLSSDAASFNKRDRKRKLDRDTQVPNKLTKRACIFCDEDHYNDECGKFQDIQARRKQLKERCFNCLGKGHQARECKRLIRCHHCAGPHNRSLCPTKNSRAGNDKPNDQVTTAMSKHVINSTSFLQTATVRVLSENKLPLCRVLLDSGSQRSYITTSLAKHLNLTPDKEDLLMIFTFGSEKPAETLSPSANITIETKRGVQKLIRVNIVPHITDRIAVPNVSHSDLVDVLADDGSGGQGVDILIGNDYYFSFIGNEKIMIDDHLHLVNTDFGWIVSGRLEQQERREVTLSVVTYHQSGCEFSHYSEPDLPLRNLDIKFLWTLENIGITDSVKATREEEVVQHFNNTIKYQNGRYYVKWPWTQSHPSLPTNYGPAYGRLKGLLLRADKATLNEYNNILQEQIQANIIEIVEPESDTTCQTTPPIHYLPHHIVKQAGKRGRIVYDASAKSKDHLSLNECLYRGPCLLQDLTALLVNFRINKIGILADVEKAFLQVGLQTEDRDVTRFLWVKNIEEPLTYDNILHLRFCRVPFGIISSPFLLNAVIRYHISTTNPDLLGSIADRCYVDNLVTGANTTEDAVKLFEETKNLFQQLSMNIRDWTSNDYALMEKIPMKSRAKQTEKTKVLGLVWNKEEDTLQLNLKDNILDPSEVTNKRQVLRVLASIYDPCGFVAPLLLPVKLFLQELWRRGYKWDTPLSPELHEEWGKISSTLYDVKDCTLPRYTGFNSCENERNIEYELHCFTDASNHGYATVAYLRADDGRNVKTTLLMSKTRIAPLEKKKGDKNESTSKAHTSPPKNKKPLTIPQMELLGYLIGSRLIAYLKKTLVLHISKQYLWTDSLVVLSWVKSNKLLPPFVTNRVDEIKQNGDVENCYINSRLNPADLATRPELWHQKKHTWLQGPDFLLANKKMWPNDRHLEDHLSTLSAVVEGLEEQPPDFTEESDRKEEERDMAESVEDNLNMNRPEMPLIDTMAEQTNNMDSEVREIKEIQSRYFPEEVKGKDSHLTRNLGLFMDVDGLLRCGGRMMHADMAYDTKHPILLPRECEYTTKVIRETHEKNYHVGVPHTLTIIRQKYWIPKGRAQVQKVLRRCPECVKHGGGPYKLPTTPALPPERVKYSAPYAFLGMDYFGPMMVKCESGNEKRWICLFTCLVVRAVHLEVVKNLTAEECLLALRRFVASRGVPTQILSDNALQFKLTSELLTSTFCVEKKIKWRFIPQLAPWHGGVYERLVGVVKHCLKRTLSKHLLGDSGLQTVIKEVEAVVNTRPLTCVGADIEYVLKPADFLSLGKCLTMNFSRDITINSDTVTKRDLIEGWKRGQNIIDEFKEMFITQYLPSLRERYKNNVKQPRVTTGKTPRVGDIVQIKSEAKNRQNWKVGKITSLVRSEDGECRVARVRVGNTEFTRSVGHLYPLEADMNDVTESGVPSEPILTETHDSREPVIQETTPVVSSPRKIQVQPMDLDLIKESFDKPNEKEVAIQESEVGEREISNPEKDNKDSEVVEQLTLPSSESRDDSEEMEIHNESELSETQEVKVRRVAAVKAREKIAEWTRQLFALL